MVLVHEAIDVAELSILTQRHCDLTGHEKPAQRARSWLKDVLDPRIGPMMLDDALLVAGELVVNAELHGSGVIGIAVESRPSMLTLWVFDRDGHCERVCRQPALPGADHEAGRGLPLVTALTTCWFTTPYTLGKAVIAVIIPAYTKAEAL
jgi:hypothetical protein